MATTNLKLGNFGEISVQTGEGNPNHKAYIGTVYKDRDTGFLYKNVSGTTWQYIGSTYSYLIYDFSEATSGGTGVDTFTTGFTYNNANTLTISRNEGQPNLTATINTMTGLTIIGNLSATTIDTEHIDFTPLAVRPAHFEGRIYWYDDEKTLELQTENANFNIEVGHQTVVRVRNTTGSPLTKGGLVYINGGSGNNPTVTLASYENDNNSARTLGFLCVTIPNNQFGYVITNGLLRDVNTSAYSAGTQLYLFTGGTYTNVRPIAPLHEVRVGVVVRQSATVGIIFAAIMNGYELGELHDVRVTSATNNDLLQYNSSISAWTNTQSIQITSLTANTISATTYQNLPSEILKKTNVVLTSTTWVSGATWYYNYNDVDVSSGDTIIFTPATSTISVVINAIVYPEITTSGGTFTIYSQNQPSGDINGEYLIIKT